MLGQHIKYRYSLLMAGLLAITMMIGTSKTVTSAPLANTTVVPLIGQRIADSSPAAADFDGDGDKEIVIGGIDGVLYVIARTGTTWSAVWVRQTAQDLNAAGAPAGACVRNVSDIRSAPAIADLNNDGRMEIVVTTGGDPGNHRNGGVLVYSYNAPWSFSVMPGWPQPRIDAVGQGTGASTSDGCWDGIWSTPAVGDLDGNGTLEVLVEGFDRRLHAWHHNGAAVGGWPIYRYNGDALLRGGWSSPALGDIDGDGRLEVVFATDSPTWGGEGTTADYTKATVWALKGDSSLLPGWPVATTMQVASSPAIGDIDGDGRVEVVVGTGVAVMPGVTDYTVGYKVYAWNGDGSPVPNWPRMTEGNMNGSPALADLDGGGLDVIIGCGPPATNAPNPRPCTKLYAWHGNGSNVPGFPMSPAGTNPFERNPKFIQISPVVADHDGNGQLDIFVVVDGSTGPTIVRANGVQSPDESRQTNSFVASAPIITDVDNDGLLETVIGGQGPNGLAAIFIWDEVGSASSAAPWPAFRRTMRRVGLIAVPTQPLTKRRYLPLVRR